MTLILTLLVFAGLALYLMRPDEREPVLRAARRLAEQAKEEAIRRWKREPSAGDRPKEPLPFVTWSIAVVTCWMFLRMLTGEGSMSEPDALVSWGASFGPRTANGEWWRLLAANFVHAGALHFAASAAGLLVVASSVERLAGHAAFAAVYVVSGTVAHLVQLNESAISVSAGASGSIFGVYGLLLAIWGSRVVRRAPIPLKWRRLKRAAPVAGLFLLHAWWTDHLGGASEAFALVAGTIGGLALAAGDYRPAPRRLAVLTAATAAAIVAMAVPVRGVADVRPEIARVVALEERISREYESAVQKFRDGRLQAPALAQQIERTILPELDASRRRLASLARVPREHRTLVASAQEYLRLRDESWRERAEALRQSRIERLRKADRLERQALEAFAAIAAN